VGFHIIQVPTVSREEVSYMELKKKHIITLIIIPFIVGIIVNFVYDMLKNHPNANKGGFKVELNFLIEFN
jgi:hypothetical protein